MKTLQLCNILGKLAKRNNMHVHKKTQQVKSIPCFLLADLPILQKFAFHTEISTVLEPTENSTVCLRLIQELPNPAINPKGFTL